VHLRARVLLLSSLLPVVGASAQTTSPAEPPAIRLAVSPRTVVWGYYSAAPPPVLRIKSGDIVTIETVVTGNPAQLEAAGARHDDMPQALWDIYDHVTDKGPGPHILTGPVFVEGAEPGDVLEVRIKRIDLAMPFAYNLFQPGSGFLPDEFPYGRVRIIPLDKNRNVAHFAPGVDIPLAPFFGSMGVAPPPAMNRVSSGPPWFNAGNIDNKELTAGSTLYIPIQAAGALFFVGDGHAGEGNGEVDLSAMETSLNGTFQFIVRKDLHLRWPRAETPTHYIAMGLNPDLTEAAKLAVREAIEFLVTEKHLSRDDAYMLVSVACDLDVTQVVDGTKGAHVLIPKAIFK
jgi:acetamidase/formamidase